MYQPNALPAGYDASVRTLPRILLNLATLASLLLAVAAAGLWARSYHSFDEYRTLNAETRRLVMVVSTRGGLQVAGIEDVWNHDGRSGLPWEVGWSSRPLTPQGVDRQLMEGHAPTRDVRRFGFRLLRGGTFYGSRFWSLRIPYWFLTLLSLPLPAWRIVHWRRHRRHRTKGHCPACGYDLRATPDRCPECGRPATPTP